MQEGKAPKADDLFSLAYSTLFEVVKYARNEEHWSLAKEEAAKLGKVSVSCLNTIPAAQKGKIEAKFSKYLPWCALLGFGMVITYPRVVLSMQAEKERKRYRSGSGPIKFPVSSQPVAKESEDQNVAPIGGDASPVANGGTSKANASSFPPGHGANFPKFDFEIPSPTNGKPS